MAVDQLRCDLSVDLFDGIAQVFLPTRELVTVRDSRRCTEILILVCLDEE